jgi:hypothetical protein
MYVYDKISLSSPQNENYFRQSSRDIQNAHCVVYDIMRKKYGTAGQTTDDNIIGHMHFACWIPKATDTHLEYAILIPFPRQQWLRERP